MCLEGKNVLQACSFNPKPVLNMQLLSAMPGTAGGTQPCSMTCFPTATKEKAGVICFCIRLEERSRNIGKGAAQATQPVGSPAVIKYQCHPPLQPSRRGRCADKSRGIKINQVLIARPQRDCRRYQQYLQMRKNSEVILKHPKLPVQTEKQERSVIKAFLQWLYTVFSHH